MNIKGQLFLCEASFLTIILYSFSNFRIVNHTYPLNKSFIRVIPQKGDYPYKGL